VTVLLDAYAAIALLRGEQAAGEIVGLLARDVVEIHPLNLAEVIDRLARLDGIEADDVEGDLALVGVREAALVPGDFGTAGRLRARHYHRTTCAVSLADCVALAHAGTSGAVLATSDPPLAGVARAEKIGLLALPDSRGERPER
jgi:PIN domain nuclease of toxin-antitoxin system